MIKTNWMAFTNDYLMEKVILIDFEENLPDEHQQLILINRDFHIGEIVLENANADNFSGTIKVCAVDAEENIVREWIKALD